MLVLHRKTEESILLYTSDGVIEVKLGDTRKGGVKMLVDAPPKVHVLRSELIDVIAEGW